MENEGIKNDTFLTGFEGPIFILDYTNREIRMEPFSLDKFLEHPNRRIIHTYKDDLRELDCIFPQWRIWKEYIEKKLK